MIDNKTFTIMISDGKSRSKYIEREVNFEQLSKAFQVPLVIPCTKKEWKKLGAQTDPDKKTQGEKIQDELKNQGSWIGGKTNGGAKKEDVINRTIVGLDCDGMIDNLYSKIKELGYASVIYPSRKNTKENRRIRIVIPLFRPISPVEYEPVSRAIADELGMRNFDDCSFQHKRILYFGTVLQDENIEKNYLAYYQKTDGDFANPDSYLARYKDFKDRNEYPLTPVEQARTKNAPTQNQPKPKEGDANYSPRNRKGIPGLFNRRETCFDVAENRLLGIALKRGTQKNRYTRISGFNPQTQREETGAENGIWITPDGMGAYSFSTNDIKPNKMMDAFDFARLYLYGKDDIGNDTKYAQQMPSYTRFKRELKREDYTYYAGEQENLDKSKPWLTENKYGAPVINASMLAEELVEEIPSFNNGKEFLIYDKNVGIWRQEAENTFRAIARSDKIGVKLSKSQTIAEVIKHVKDGLFKKYMLSENEPFDKPLPDTLIINNGVYHIESGKFIAGFDPDLHARSRHNIDYNPHAKCPAFIEMMTKLFGKDNLEFIFAWFGYCLYRAYPIQQFLIIEGRGGKGKSTLLNILRDFVGKENTSALKLPVLVNSDDRFSKVFLVGKTLNIDADAKPAHLGDGSELKGLTGEDMVSVEIKGGDMFQYYNYAKLTFAMNFLPPYMDDSGGTERRALILPATGETFSIKKYRALLAQIEKEKSGIFIQAMKFLKKTLHDENFPQSQTMLKRADEWKRDNDNVLTFLEEKADTTDPDQHVKSQELYNSFRDYCSDIGSHPVGMKKFVQNLKSKQYEQIRKGDGMYWKGIELKNNPETNWK